MKSSGQILCESEGIYRWEEMGIGKRQQYERLAQAVLANDAIRKQLAEALETAAEFANEKFDEEIEKWKYARPTTASFYQNYKDQINAALAAHEESLR